MRKAPKCANANPFGWLLPAVGATLVVAPFAYRVRQEGDHKGRPYNTMLRRTSPPLSRRQTRHVNCAEPPQTAHPDTFPPPPAPDSYPQPPPLHLPPHHPS